MSAQDVFTKGWKSPPTSKKTPDPLRQPAPVTPKRAELNQASKRVGFAGRPAGPLGPDRRGRTIPAKRMRIPTQEAPLATPPIGSSRLLSLSPRLGWCFETARTMCQCTEWLVQMPFRYRMPAPEVVPKKNGTLPSSCTGIEEQG